MATAVTKPLPTETTAITLFSSPGKRRAVLSLLLLLFTLAVYNPAAHDGFVTFDDPVYITSNTQVQSGLNWNTVKWAFRSTEGANWFPMTWLSHALDCQLFHANPSGHHYTSVILHAFSVILLFLLLDIATEMFWRAWMVAALFALHPINVESVAWLSERKSVLCTLFFLLTLLSYSWYSRQPNLKRYGLVALMFALALASKPMAVTLPFVLLLLDYWPLRRVAVGAKGDQRTWTRLILEKLPLLLLSAASCIVTMIVQKAGGAIHSNYPFRDRALNAIVSYTAYLRKAVWPNDLAAFYPHPQHPPSYWKMALAVLVLLAVSYAVATFRSKRYLVVGWLWFLGTLVPVIGLVQVGEQAMADRYAYIPFIGLFVATVWAMGDLIAHKRIPTAYVVMASALTISGLSARTHVQVGYWKDTITLWTHAIEVTENNDMAHDSLGAELIDQGRIREAATHFEAAAAANPKDAFSQLDLGVCEKRQGHLEAAMQRYQAALRLSSEPSLRATAFGNIGSVYRATGDYAKARESYESALAMIPNNKFAYIGLGIIAQKTGDYAGAVEFYSKAVKVEPSGPEYLLLAQALEKTGRRQEADAAYDKAHANSRDWTATEQAVNHLLHE